MGKKTDKAKKLYAKLKPYGSKAGKAARSTAKKGYELSQRIEFNSPEQLQKAGAVWGFETPQANKLVAERKKSKKKTRKTKRK